jgi:hypothetical protein
MKKKIEVNPEFASEIVLCVPYAYYLHKNNLLDSVVTSKGMKPFYYFCDNVIDNINFRTLDNSIALRDVPNKWLHNSEAGGRRNGVIDYREWIAPPYKEYYKNNLFDDLKPYVVINNIYNIEPGKLGFRPYRYFDITNLYQMFEYLTEKGYNVIYKRPDNTEFVLDQNEVNTIETNVKLFANTEEAGKISDYELCEYFNNKVINLNKLVKKHSDLDYSTLNLKLFAEAEGFVTITGGGGFLCSYFDKPVIMYVNKGPELRPNYMEYEDSYIRKLSKAPIYGVYDNFEFWEKNGGRDYKKLLTTVQTVFK